MEYQAGSTLCISHGTLIDGTASPPVGDAAVLIKGERIERVGTVHDIHAPEECTTINARGMTVMPGLIDVHVHLNTPVVRDGRNLQLEILKTPPTLAAFYSFWNGMEAMRAGFTTLRDMGGYGTRNSEESVSLRRAIDMGLVPGPRILSAGAVLATAGHVDLGFVSRATPWVPSAQDCVDGVWEVRKRVRSLIREDVNLIKVFASGWGGEVEEPWWRNFTQEELEAIVDEAHAHGLKVAAHAASPETVKLSLRAGVDTIEHLVDIDDECLDLFSQKGAYLVPTLGLFSEKALERRGRHQPPEAVQAVRKGRKTAWKAFRRCLQKGVRMANGSDTYRTLVHGENADELVAMHRAGMSCMEVLVAATRNAAEACGLAKELGTIEPGKLADILVVEGDPLTDVGLLQDRSNIRKVIKGGEVVVER
ncbi:MAG: amidohydrolase family protein [Deltaproteobacteria bacterium]|nr:amidohydrolase family protein [Deltaproteobacteria bacterium]MBW2308657.1 amidohydrolase family protein [Deltaproteobacteria bacterium]